MRHPCSYTRHTSRFLVVWLTFLPCGLAAIYGWLTIPICGVVAFLLAGVEVGWAQSACALLGGQLARGGGSRAMPGRQ